MVQWHIRLRDIQSMPTFTLSHLSLTLTELTVLLTGLLGVTFGSKVPCVLMRVFQQILSQLLIALTSPVPNGLVLTVDICYLVPSPAIKVNPTDPIRYTHHGHRHSLVGNATDNGVISTTANEGISPHERSGTRVYLIE